MSLLPLPESNTAASAASLEAIARESYNAAYRDYHEAYGARRAAGRRVADALRALDVSEGVLCAAECFTAQSGSPPVGGHFHDDAVERAVALDSAFRRKLPAHDNWLDATKGGRK